MRDPQLSQYLQFKLQIYVDLQGDMMAEFFAS